MKRLISVLTIILLISTLVPNVFITHAAEKKKITSLDLEKNQSLMLEIGKKTEAKNKELKSKDTDGDGLNDFFEKQNYLNRSAKDSNKNKLADDKEDIDKDKLTNVQEQKYNTSARLPDTDYDQLSDYDEINIHHTNPNKKDSDKDNISDGIELKKFQTNPLIKDSKEKFNTSIELPKNKWNITGKISGVGDLTGRYKIRNSPILLLSQMKSVETFDIWSLTDIHYSINIPVKSDQKDLKLYRYEYQNLKKQKQEISLQLVPNQSFDSKTNTIHAEFDGGDSFVLLSETDMKTVSPQKTNSKSSKLSKKGRIKGIPNLSIDPSQISKDGEWNLQKDVTFKSKTKHALAKYKVQTVESENGVEYASLVPNGPESGLNYVILLHGFAFSGASGGTSESVGFTNNWTQDDEDYAEADVAIPSNQTFSGLTYQSGDRLKYDNPDVQFITGIVADDTNNLGPVLTNLASIGHGDDGYPEYTPNYDLFIFEYDNDDTNIHKNSEYLNKYIQNLRNIGKIAVYQGTNVPVSIVGHSMGGLVARYFVENLDLQTDNDVDVNHLMTIGTPHFGAGIMSWLGGDMDREESCLWNGGNPETGCEELKDTHNSSTSYALYSGQNEVVDEDGSTAFFWAPNYWDIPGSFNEYYQEVLNTTEDLDDDWVEIDSALGSDADAGYELGPVENEYSFLVSGPQGQHSEMLRNGDLQWDIYFFYLLRGTN